MNQEPGNNMPKKTILLGLTTTPKSDWREKVREIKKYDIKELALFPTFLNPEERKELYTLLDSTNLEKIPHVHLRDDMEKWELDYFIDNYQTEVFNIHYDEKSAKFFQPKYEKYIDNIYIENQSTISKEMIEALPKCGGICLDTAHWQDYGINQQLPSYKDFKELITKYSIGCCHISDVQKTKTGWLNHITNQTEYSYSHHYSYDMSDLNYVKKFTKHLPKYLSIELQNPFKEQIEIKKYLDKIINNQI